MNWHLDHARMLARSHCGLYEMRGVYNDGSFSWRGRVIDTDQLIASSADRSYVELCCERHAAKTEAEAV